MQECEKGSCGMCCPSSPQTAKPSRFKSGDCGGCANTNVFVPAHICFMNSLVYLDTWLGALSCTNTAASSAFVHAAICGAYTLDRMLQ